MDGVSAINPALLQEALKKADAEEKGKLLAILEELEKRQLRDRAQNDFLAFVETQWPDFVCGAHHRRIAKVFEDIAAGKKKRVIINLAPRHTKSEFASFLLPAWILGKFPKKKVLQVSNTAELAEGFGRKVRNLLDTETYRDIFPNVELRSDSKAAGRWNTNHGGDYYATGVGAALAGRGADLAIVDDPHTEAEALQSLANPGIYDKVYDWYTSGIRQRLQPGGAIIIVQTRWSLRDLTGQVLENAHRTGASEEWEVFEFPAILPSGKPLWPEYWSLEELEAVKADISARGLGKWNAQYQQQPTSDENAIIKRDWWQTWEKKDPPPVDYIIMAMDTAHEAKNSADYSVAVFFGVWNNPDDDDQPNLILLNAWRDKLEFPELKAKAFELYKKWEPDSVIIEKKASGAPLITELRRAGIPVQEYTPSRGTAASPNNKIARLHAISDIFASKRVWAPRKPWADDLIDEIASFPSGRYDDYVDATSLCLTRFRVGGFIGTRADIVDSDENWKFKAKKAAYY